MPVMARISAPVIFAATSSPQASSISGSATPCSTTVGQRIARSSSRQSPLAISAPSWQGNALRVESAIVFAAEHHFQIGDRRQVVRAGYGQEAGNAISHHACAIALPRQRNEQRPRQPAMGAAAAGCRKKT